jgi:hypothetical protein
MLNKIEDGVIRIGRDLKVYQSKNGTWKVSNKEFPDALKIISLFRVHGNLYMSLYDNNGGNSEYVTSSDSFS